VVYLRAWRGIIEEYREYLPIERDMPVVTLLEGNTPLLPAGNLAQRLEADIEIYLKFEGLNPTGSFKDRGMTLAVSKAVQDGAPVVVCASTGNTAASAAAYAARAGLRCIVVIPHAAVASGKLAQARVHGAQIVSIRGNFDVALAIVRELAAETGIVLVNSVNPWRIEGQKTAAFEIVNELGDAPDWLVIPVGNAGNITAYWKGFNECRVVGMASRCPRMAGYQATGAAPIVLGMIVKNPHTLASAIRIGNPASWAGAKTAADDSGGLIDSVSDGEIMEAYSLLAAVEGIFAEPSSCTSVAGVIKMARLGRFEKGQRVVAVLTGHGLKDPEAAMACDAYSLAGRSPEDGSRAVEGVVDADVESVRGLLGV
jgi:threonine synthase